MYFSKGSALTWILAAVSSARPITSPRPSTTACAQYFAPTDHGLCFGRHCGPQNFPPGVMPTHCAAAAAAAAASTEPTLAPADLETRSSELQLPWTPHEREHESRREYTVDGITKAEKSAETRVARSEAVPTLGPIPVALSVPGLPIMLPVSNKDESAETPRASDAETSKARAEKRQMFAGPLPYNVPKPIINFPLLPHWKR